MSKYSRAFIAGINFGADYLRPCILTSLFMPTPALYTSRIQRRKLVFQCRQELLHYGHNSSTLVSSVSLCPDALSRSLTISVFLKFISSLGMASKSHRQSAFEYHLVAVAKGEWSFGRFISPSYFLIRGHFQWCTLYPAPSVLPIMLAHFTSRHLGPHLLYLY